jgi:cardiolipin synthase
VSFASRMLYDHLLRAGVRIYEYCERPLHAKVALADDEWATVGSSNLDPLSLSLNLEANVIIRDRAFTLALRERLEHLIRDSCTEIDPQRASDGSWWRLAASYLMFHVARRFPAWAGWLPAHKPRLAPASAYTTAPGALSPTGGDSAAGDAAPEPWSWRGERVDERQPDYSVP